MYRLPSVSMRKKPSAESITSGSESSQSAICVNGCQRHCLSSSINFLVELFIAVVLSPNGWVSQI